MPLKVTIDLVGYYGYVDRKITEIYIGREEDLKSRQGGEHQYSVSPQVSPWEPLVYFRHEYSDGANKCVMRALEALEEHSNNSEKESSHGTA